LQDQPNIILIVLDTMRRDYLECYNPAVKTPNLKKMCEDSVVYLDAIAPSSWTIPSHASMFTGKFVSNHGIHETHESKRWEDMHEKMKIFKGNTLAEELSALGYNTAGITANSYVGPGTGFDRGFKHMMYNGGITDYLYSKLNDNVIRPISLKVRGGRKEILKKTLSLKANPIEIFSYYRKYRHLLGRLKEEGFPVRKDGDNIIRTLKNSSFESPAFFFLNFMEVHEPYKNILERYGANFRVFMKALFGDLVFTQKDIEDIRKDYLEESLLLDTYLGDLFSFIKSQGIYDDSLIIVTSDHGQSLVEHGFFGHGIYLYDELVRVPLIIKYPSRFNRKGFSGGYFNIKDLYSLILSFARGEGIVEPISEITFSETYGLHEDVSGVIDIKDEKYRKMMDEIDSPRKAVFKKGMKLSVNMKTGSVEEFSVNGKPIEPKQRADDARELLNELYLFKGKESIPQITI